MEKINKDLKFLKQPAEIIIFLYTSKANLNTTKIAKKFKSYQGNITKTLAKLEKINLIKKCEGKDKREIKICLTKKGERIGRRLVEIKEELRI